MNIAIIYPNQLFEKQFLPYDLKKMDQFIIIEDPLYFRDEERQLNFNMLKLIFQRACMKYYESYLQKFGVVVEYLDFKPDPAHLFKHIKSNFKKNNTLHIIDPVDFLLEKRIGTFSKKYGQYIKFYETPAFISTNLDLEDYMENHKTKAKKQQFFQYNFYIWQRKRLNILMDENGKPLGGKYSYDKYNRMSIPGKDFDDFVKRKKIKLPKQKNYRSHFYDDAIIYCENTFENHYPDLYFPENIYRYPISHTDAKNHFKNFLKYKLRYFGDFQDAIDFNADLRKSNRQVDSTFSEPRADLALAKSVEDLQKSAESQFRRSLRADLASSKSVEDTMFHSVISPQQNIGLLTPLWVMEKTLQFYEKSKIKKKIFPDTEAFIRQLNWREYSRLLYRYANDLMLSNYLGNNRNLTHRWYNGSTGIGPIDLTIKQAFSTGYIHHIMRLMIMCNFMNLCMIKPDQAYKWFMEFSLDSYDWVMINNVYSMGLWADGGVSTTKPYVSSSNYVLHMSNAKKDGYWEIVWNVLYYYFIYRNRNKLSGRGKIYIPQWEKQKKKDGIIKNAKKAIKMLTTKN